MTDSPLPRGFSATTAENGEMQLHYRTSGMRSLAVFFAVFLSIWTAGCVELAESVLFDPFPINLIFLVFMVPFGLCEIWIIALVARIFLSVTTFAFKAEELVVERSLWKYVRRDVISRSEITAAKQVKDGGAGEDLDSFPTWGLTVITSKEICILSRQPIDKSDWLGLIVADWAGVAFEPAINRIGHLKRDVL